MILALACVVNYDRQSDAPIWSVTSSGINYDRNKFIIQATDQTGIQANKYLVAQESSYTSIPEPFFSLFSLGVRDG